MPHAIGIDIGVTYVKCVVVSDAGEIVLRDQTGTHAEKSDWPEGVKKYIGGIERQRGEAQWLGFAAPGLAAPDGSCISWMQGRLEEVEGLKWTEFLGRKRAVPVLNDAQAALLGEVWKGSAAGARNAILLTLGTGVGGAILVDGRILRGQIGRGGHIGHMCLDVDGENDIVKTPGSLEGAIGNYTVQKRSSGKFESTLDLVAAAQRGDQKALEIWERSVQQLGCAIVSMINIADPEVVIIGGGIATAGSALFEPLKRVLDEHEWRPHGHRARIVAATLGEFAGALGAAFNAMQPERGNP
ncbi:MAG TPA: ROK family protein [Tepidisphaeraceae bacterium]|jgi:glucokinase|nr:ROK family protein [Tepidisphaeraceae bacterium]